MGVPQIRLSVPGEVGSNLYNSYQFLAQLAALYIKARLGDVAAGSEDEWIALSDSALSDLGSLVALWEAQIAQPSAAVSPLEDKVVAQRLIRLCRRAERLESLTTLWTPSLKWTQVMIQVEGAWSRLMENFCRLDPSLRPKLVGPVEASKRRLVRLMALADAARAERESLNKAYHVPSSLVSEAS